MRVGVAVLAWLVTLASPLAESQAGRHQPIHAYRWRKGDGACRVPKPFRPWSWSRLHRVKGLPPKTIVFTVDGGLLPEALATASAQLAALDVRATFFLMTDSLSKSPRGKEIVRGIVADGHELGNHSVSHPKLTKLDDEQVKGELVDAERTARRRASAASSACRSMSACRCCCCSHSSSRFSNETILKAESRSSVAVRLSCERVSARPSISSTSTCVIINMTIWFSKILLNYE